MARVFVNVPWQCGHKKRGQPWWHPSFVFRHTRVRIGFLPHADQKTLIDDPVEMLFGPILRPRPDIDIYLILYTAKKFRRAAVETPYASSMT